MANATVKRRGKEVLQEPEYVINSLQTEEDYAKVGIHAAALEDLMLEQVWYFPKEPQSMNV